MATITKVQGVAARAASGTSVTTTISAATAGNLIVGFFFGDKNTGAITVPGSTNVVTSNNQTSVSCAMFYKIAAGGETSFEVTYATSRQSGLYILELNSSTGWDSYNTIATYADAGFGDENAVTSRSSGTTEDLAQSYYYAVAMWAADTGTQIDGGRAYTNSFTEDTFVMVTSGDAGGPVALKQLSATSAVESTFSTTDSGDQMNGIVAIFIPNADATAKPAFLQYQ